MDLSRIALKFHKNIFSGITTIFFVHVFVTSTVDATAGVASSIEEVVFNKYFEYWIKDCIHL